MPQMILQISDSQLEALNKRHAETGQSNDDMIAEALQAYLRRKNEAAVKVPDVVFTVKAFDAYKVIRSQKTGRWLVMRSNRQAGVCDVIVGDRATQGDATKLKRMLDREEAQRRSEYWESEDFRVETSAARARSWNVAAQGAV